MKGKNKRKKAIPNRISIIIDYYCYLFVMHHLFDENKIIREKSAFEK